MKTVRVVDLSHTLYPGREEYILEVKTSPVADLLPQYRQKEGEWYVMSEVTLQTHVGTHVELPYHHVKHGTDAAATPLEVLTGEAVLLDFSRKAENDAITLDDVRVFAGIIHPGDIVLIRTGCDRNYRTERQHSRPYLTRDSVEWLVKQRKVKCLGVDMSGIEDRSEPYQPNHLMLLENGVPLIEYLANLDALTRERFWLMVLPLKIVGIEACPVRVVALECDD